MLGRPGAPGDHVVQGGSSAHRAFKAVALRAGLAAASSQRDAGCSGTLHEPPQSTPSSSPFCSPSEQPAGVRVRVKQSKRCTGALEPAAVHARLVSVLHAVVALGAVPPLGNEGVAARAAAVDGGLVAVLHAVGARRAHVPSDAVARASRPTPISSLFSAPSSHVGHTCPEAPSHEPPQSTPTSSPFWAPSPHEGHTCPATSSHEPPQSTPISSPLRSLSAHVGHLKHELAAVDTSSFAS